MDYDAMDGLEDLGPRVTVREVQPPQTTDQELETDICLGSQEFRRFYPHQRRPRLREFPAPHHPCRSAHDGH